MKKTSRFIVLTALIGCSCLFAECPLGCTCPKCQAKQQEQSCPRDCSCPKCQGIEKRKCLFSNTKLRVSFTGDHPAECTCPRCEVEKQDEKSNCSPAEKASVQGPLKGTYPKIALA